MSKKMIDIARSYMPPAQGKTEVIHSFGDTQDIVQEVLETHRLYYHETDQFAEKLQGADHRETAKNIWAFLRKAVAYRLDPEGEQFTKSPARVIADGFSDCKGYSIFTASVLENLGIPYFFRFVDYSPGSDTPTHVYVVLKGNDGIIPIDACWQFFSKEKKYTYVQDEAPMTRISRLSGTVDPLLEGTVMLDLMIERLQLEQQLARRISGVGTIYDAEYSANIRQLQRLKNNPALLYEPGISGISDFVRKVADRVKSGFQAFKKAITEPQKAFAELLLKTLLPAASPYFLYLFVQDPQKIKALPAPVQAKRAKMFRIANNIVNATGMDETVFMSIVRNGIMKSLQKTPEQAIADAMAGKVSGIGFAWGTIIQTVITIITKVVALFKGVKENLSPADAPDFQNDFKSLPGSGDTTSGGGSSGSGTNILPESGNGPLPPGMLPNKGAGDSGSAGSSGSGGPSTGIIIGLGLLALLSLK